MSTRLIIIKIYIYSAPFKCYCSGSLLNTAQPKRRLGEHKMSQSVPSAVPKRVHYTVKSQPLNSPQRGRLVKCGLLRTRRDVRIVVLFIIPVCFASALHGSYLTINCNCSMCATEYNRVIPCQFNKWSLPDHFRK